MSAKALLAAALCALGLLLPAQALADENAPPAPADPAAVPEAEDEAVEPAAPTAEPAQSEDTSGADQYTEPGIPGSEPPAEPTTPEPDPTPAPQPTAPPTATVAQDESAVPVVSAEDTLPRTGLETGLIAFLGVALLGVGVLVRRLPAAQSPSR